jgi:hypothetical protein
MNKKIYVKPAVVTRTVALGVFGNYGSHNGGKGRDGEGTPLPIRIVSDQKLRME